MTHSMECIRTVSAPAAAIPKRPMPALIVLAAIALGGCSGTNVGSTWQCPLAQGASCDSVAAADPAAPDMAAGKPVLREPLYRERGAGDAGAVDEASVSGRPCDAGCSGGFDPFGWLAKLLGPDGDDDTPPVADTAAKSAAPPPSPESQPGDAPADTAPVSPQVPDVEAAALPAGPAPAADLRTGEVVGRIWIAPFVDGNGVYREASHVRVVLEPASWRVP